MYLKSKLFFLKQIYCFTFIQVSSFVSFKIDISNPLSKFVYFKPKKVTEET